MNKKEIIKILEGKAFNEAEEILRNCIVDLKIVSKVCSSEYLEKRYKSLNYIN